MVAFEVVAAVRAAFALSFEAPAVVLAEVAPTVTGAWPFPRLDHDRATQDQGHCGHQQQTELGFELHDTLPSKQVTLLPVRPKPSLGTGRAVFCVRQKHAEFVRVALKHPFSSFTHLYCRERKHDATASFFVCDWRKQGAGQRIVAY